MWKTGFFVSPNSTKRDCRILQVSIWSKIDPLFSVQDVDILKQTAYHCRVWIYWRSNSRREMTLPSPGELRKKSQPLGA